MKTIVYGVTANTRAFLHSTKDDSDIIIASTSGLESFDDHNVLSLKELKQVVEALDLYRVVICSQFISEITNSLLSIGVALETIYFFDHAKRNLRRISELSTAAVDSNSILYAVYDLRYNLPTYDFVNFCVRADAERQLKGLKSLHLIVVPNNSSNQSNLLFNPFHTEEDIKWRQQKIFLGILSCIQSVSGYQFLSYAEQLEDIYATFSTKHFFPNQSNEVVNIRDFLQLKEKADLSIIKAPFRASKLVSKYLEIIAKKKKVISVTLRDYGFHDDRNTDKSEWSKFLANLDLDKYHPVIIQDTYNCTSPLPVALRSYDEFSLAAVDFTIRTALYEQSFINMSVSNGATFSVNYMKNCNSITFMKVDKNNPAITPETFEKAGVSPNKHIPFRDNNNQWLFWGEANADNIEKAFIALAGEIDD